MKEFNLASILHCTLEEQITMVQDSLDKYENLEIVVAEAPNGFILDALGFSDPHLIIFYGHIFDGGEEIRLLQHVSRVSLYLKIVKRDNPDAPRRKIEFSFDD